MPTALTIEAKKTALLVMDFQSAIVEGFAADKSALLDRTKTLLDAARGTGIMVIYVVVGFRAGYPEISEHNKSFLGIKETGRFAAGDAASEIHPAVAPMPDEIVVTKHRVSAFAGTDLDMILRANRIETLVLAGIATGGVVLSTVRHGADADYHLIVVSDCCSDRDNEVHRVLLEKVFARQADVVALAELIHALGAV